MDCSTPGLPVHYQLLELTQTHVHWVGDAVQPSRPLLPRLLPHLGTHSADSCGLSVCMAWRQTGPATSGGSQEASSSQGLATQAGGDSMLSGQVQLLPGDWTFFPPFELKYCWFSTLGQFQVISKVIQLETHTHTHTHTYFFFHIFFHYRLWQYVEYSFLFYTVGPCWLSILYIVVQLCPTLFGPMDCGMPGFPVLPYLPEFAQTHVHGVSEAIEPSHPLMPSSPPALNLVVCIY